MAAKLKEERAKKQAGLIFKEKQLMAKLKEKQVISLMILFNIA